MKPHTEPFIGAKFDNDIWGFYRRKIWQRYEYFFQRQSRSKTILYQNLLVCIHSYSSTHFILKNFLTRLKNFFSWNCIPTPFAGNIWQRHDYFFHKQFSLKTILFQNLLACIQSYSSTHFIWTSSLLDWKIFFVKWHTDTFWGQNLTTTWVLFSWTTQIKSSLCFKTTRMHTLLL